MLSASTSERLEPIVTEVRAIARRYRLAVGGAGADAAGFAATEELAMTGDPAAEADRIASLLSETRS